MKRQDKARAGLSVFNVMPALKLTDANGKTIWHAL